jgi:hypothetical protein
MSDLDEQALDDDQRKACNAMLCETVARHFPESLGFCENTGHMDYIIDERPYVGARGPT